MAKRADIPVENFAPGRRTASRRRRRSARVNPRLIYGSSRATADGPYRDYPAMDLAMQACAASSIARVPGSAARQVGRGPCDFMAGIHLYAAIVTALL
jgi:formyl-CoA transferase